MSAVAACLMFSVFSFFLSLNRYIVNKMIQSIGNILSGSLIHDDCENLNTCDKTKRSITSSKL